MQARGGEAGDVALVAEHDDVDVGTGRLGDARRARRIEPPLDVVERQHDRARDGAVVASLLGQAHVDQQCARAAARVSFLRDVDPLESRARLREELVHVRHPAQGSDGSERLRWVSGARSPPADVPHDPRRAAHGRRARARTGSVSRRRPHRSAPDARGLRHAGPSRTVRSCASRATTSCTSAPARHGAHRLTTLRAAAEFVGVPLGAPANVYTPATALDPDAAARGRRAGRHERSPSGTRSRTCVWPRSADATPTTAPSSRQLWPEHFDLAIDLGDEAAGTRANYGASPGDDTIAEPYLYVGPWDPARKTGPFGRAAVRRRADVLGSSSPRPIPSAAALDFFDSARAALSVARARPGNLAGMTQTFTRMDQSTAEQWAVIGRETSEHQSRVADRALDCCVRSPRSPTVSPSTSSRTRCRPRRGPSAAAPIPRWCSRRCCTTSARP